MHRAMNLSNAHYQTCSCIRRRHCHLLGDAAPRGFCHRPWVSLRHSKIGREWRGIEALQFST